MPDDEKIAENETSDDAVVDEGKEIDLAKEIYVREDNDKPPTDKKPAEDTEDKKDKSEDKKPDDETKPEDTVEDDDHIGIKPEEDEADDKKKDDKKSDDDSDADDKDKKKPDGEKDKGDDKSDAPEDYKLQVREDSLLGADAPKAVEEYAKKHKLSQEAAEDALSLSDKAVEEYEQYLNDTADERAASTIKANKAAWYAAAQKDPDIGGDKLSKFVAAGNRLINAVARDDFKTLLKVSGIGNHKEFIHFVGTAGMKLLDDDVDLGGDETPKEKSLEDHIYSTM